MALDKELSADASAFPFLPPSCDQESQTVLAPCQPATLSREKSMSRLGSSAPVGSLSSESSSLSHCVGSFPAFPVYSVSK